MTQEFGKFEAIRSQGGDALAAYLVAASDGIDQITSIRMLREVFGLSLEEARKVCFLGDTGETYEEQEGKLLDEFTQILDDELGLD